METEWLTCPMQGANLQKLFSFPERQLFCTLQFDLRRVLLTFNWKNKVQIGKSGFFWSRVYYCTCLKSVVSVHMWYFYLIDHHLFLFGDKVWSLNYTDDEQQSSYFKPLQNIVECVPRNYLTENKDV